MEALVNHRMAAGICEAGRIANGHRSTSGKDAYQAFFVQVKFHCRTRGRKAERISETVAPAF